MYLYSINYLINFIRNFFNKYLYFSISVLILYYIFFLLLIFNYNNLEYQFRHLYEIFNINILIGLDGINILLIFLVVLITPIIIFIREKYNKENKTYQLILILIELTLILILLILDIFYFYTFFELLLIPLYLILIKYGSRYKKYEASNRLFIYTIGGSLLLLLAIIIINIKYGTTNIELLELELKFENEFFKLILWMLLIIPFAIKIPIFPFHLWLPEAHTEAPTTGSVLLAAIILKLGVYGILRFNITLLDNINLYISPIILTMSFISILYSNFIILRLIDLKRIIAYSSIIHMNYVIIGLFTYEYHSITGSYITIISHAFISSSLFILIGILYRRYFTRNLLYYKGLFNIMPIFSIILFYFILSNISLPTTSSFPGEILIFFGSFKFSFFFSFFLLILILFSTTYNIIILNKIIFGKISIYLNKFKDISLNEILSLVPFIFFNFIFGFNSTLLIDIFYPFIFKIFILA